MNYNQGDYASTHSHPNEQSGYVISGKYKIMIDGNIAHSIEVIEAGEVIDVFTPIREDYL